MLTEVKSGTFIYEAPGVLTREFCASVVAAFEADTAGQYVGKTDRGDSEYKRTVDVGVNPADPRWAAIDTQMLAVLTLLAREYIALHPGLQEHPLRDTGYIIGRYKAGEGKYDWHVDDSDPREPIKRRLSAVVYLNDVAVGGETEFLHQQVKVKPECGKVVLFPGAWTHVHRGCMPTSGDKYIVTTFMFPFLAA